MAKHPTKILAILTILALLLVACGGTGSGGADEATGDFENVAVDAPGAPAEGGDVVQDDGSRGGITPSNQVITPPGRDIIFTAQMTVAVVDVAKATGDATKIVQDLGGFVFGQDSTGLPEPRSVLVFKVDPSDFQTVMDALGSVGELRDQKISADDVTERVVDLESRITTAEASVLRLRELVGQADNVEILAQLENQLLERETQLETLRGQLRTLQDAVSLATITLTLVENLSRPSMQVISTAYFGHEDAGQSCPGSPGITVDEGDPVTVCVEIVNTGDTPLTDFTITDTVLELGTGDWTIILGDIEGTLDRGQSLIVATEINPERRIRTTTRVGASPVNEEGTVLEARAVSQVASLQVTALDPGGLPGFEDGLSSGWEVLQIIWGSVVVSTGFIAGLAPLLALVFGFIWWQRRRRHGAREAAIPPVPSWNPGGSDRTDDKPEEE